MVVEDDDDEIEDVEAHEARENEDVKEDGDEETGYDSSGDYEEDEVMRWT
jgi:hypothetical protein